MADQKNHVRKLREAQLMSKAELARKAGLSPLTIDRVEAGKPSRMDTRRKIILALGYKLSERHKVFPEEGGEQEAVQEQLGFEEQGEQPARGKTPRRRRTDLQPAQEPEEQPEAPATEEVVEGSPADEPAVEPGKAGGKPLEGESDGKPLEGE
ncbi:MAG: helix-turn-helix transcriptional regulator [Myxococcota bacterium]